MWGSGGKMRTILFDGCSQNVLHLQQDIDILSTNSRSIATLEHNLAFRQHSVFCPAHRPYPLRLIPSRNELSNSKKL